MPLEVPLRCYDNQVTGALSGAPITLRALHVFEPGASASVYVNLFTHLASERADGLVSEGSAVADAVSQAETRSRSWEHAVCAD